MDTPVSVTGRFKSRVPQRRKSQQSNGSRPKEDLISRTNSTPPIESSISISSYVKASLEKSNSHLDEVDDDFPCTQAFQPTSNLSNGEEEIYWDFHNSPTSRNLRQRIIDSDSPEVPTQESPAPMTLIFKTSQKQQSYPSPSIGLSRTDSDGLELLHSIKRISEKKACDTDKPISQNSRDDGSRQTSNDESEVPTLDKDKPKGDFFDSDDDSFLIAASQAMEDNLLVNDKDVNNAKKIASKSNVSNNFKKPITSKENSTVTKVSKLMLNHKLNDKIKLIFF